MGYTLSQAATATGKDKSTISKAIKKGRISAKKDEKGQWNIDPAELHRVYPPVQQRNKENATTGNRELLLEIAALKGQIEAASEREKLKDDVLEDLRKDRDQWRRQATALLTDQRNRNGGFWSRLFGK
jgi:3-hydroxyacyl-CoA dehydrogenase